MRIFLNYVRLIELLLIFVVHNKVNRLLITSLIWNMDLKLMRLSINYPFSIILFPASSKKLVYLHQLVDIYPQYQQEIQNITTDKIKFFLRQHPRIISPLFHYIQTNFIPYTQYFGIPKEYNENRYVNLKEVANNPFFPRRSRF